MLDISENPLKSLPEDITRLTKLRKLFCLHCDLTALPGFIGSLIYLEELRMSVNFIVKFPQPDLLSKLRHLKVLELTMCNLQEIPICIFVFSNLRELDLQCNKLKYIQKELAYLDRLKVLNLADNELKTFPEVVCSLANLKSLNMSRNGIRAISPRVSELTQLLELKVNQNKITHLPMGLFILKDLEILHLDSNRLSSLQPQLKALTKLGESKDSFTVHDNPLKSPPISTCLRGFYAIVEYFKDTDTAPRKTSFKD